MNSRTFGGVVNDKGGAGKSLVDAELRVWLEDLGAPAWTFVEVEQRPWFSQELYDWSHSRSKLRTIPLLQFDSKSGRTELSLDPLDELLEFIPKDDSPANILADFGASAFQSTLLWLAERRALSKFRAAKFRFIFFVPTIARDVDSTNWVNQNVPALRQIGSVILVKNQIKGSDFSGINEAILLEIPSITLPCKGSPLMDEMSIGGRRLTFRQVAAGPSSRRAKIDAEYCDQHLTEQFNRVLKPILFPTP